MTPAPHIAKYSTGLDRSVEIYGDRVWFAICDHFPCDRLFTVAECIPLVRAAVGDITERYARAIVQGVLQTAETHGTAHRHGRMRWSV